MSGNLPPGTTHADIDRHFGEPETRTVHGTVEVAVSVETQFFDDDREAEKELLQAAEDGDIIQVLEAHIEEVE